MTVIEAGVLGLPVFEVTAEVTYSKSRRPTVIERMVMRLTRMAGDQPQIGQASLRHVFEGQLAMRGVPALLEKSVDDLRVLKALDAGVADPKRVLDLPIAQLRLTDRGLRYYLDDELPARPRTQEVTAVYQPWDTGTGRLTTLSASYRSEPPAAHLPAETVQPGDFAEYVQRAVESNRPDWYQSPQVQMQAVEQTSVRVGWLHRDIAITLGAGVSPEVTVARDPLIQQWLANLEPGLVYEHVVLAMLPKAEELPTIPLDSLPPGSQLRPCTSPPIGSRGRVLTLHRDGSTLTAAVAVASQEHPGAPEPQPVPAAWDEAMRFVTRSPGAATEAVLCGAVAVRVGRRTHHAACEVRIRGEAAERAWMQAAPVVERIIQGSDDPSWLPLCATWGSTLPLQALAPLRSEADLKGWTDLASGLIGVSDAVEPGWWPAWWQQLERSAVGSAEGTVSIGSVTGWLERSQTLPDPGRGSAGVTAALLACAAASDDLRSLERLRKLLPDGQLLPARLYGVGAVKELLTRTLAQQQPPIPPTPWQDLLDKLRHALPGARRALGGGRTRMPVAEAWITTDDFLEVAEQVQQRFSHLPPDALAPITAISQQVSTWRASRASELQPRDPAGRRHLVLDTNTLMHHPELITQATGNEVVVVPTAVIEELDRLKSDPTRGPQARAAVRALDTATSRWQQAPTPAHLLPKGSAGKGDDAVLAVAAHYLLNRPTLLTGDKNLRNRASNLRCQATDWPTYRATRGSA